LLLTDIFFFIVVSNAIDDAAIASQFKRLDYFSHWRWC
jgi:hypothetical protein